MIEARVAGVPSPRSLRASRSCSSSTSLPAVSIAPSRLSLGVGLRRRGLAPPDERLVRAGLAGAELGQLLARRPCLRVVLAGIEHGPAGLDHPDPPGPERHAGRLAGDGRHLLHAGGVEGGDQADDDGVEDLLGRRRQGPRRLAGGDDRVVVADLRVVDDPAG